MESAMPRPRYRQDPLPIGPDAPQVELFGPKQPQSPRVGADAAGAPGGAPPGAPV
jgi:hypothetical protein